VTGELNTFKKLPTNPTSMNNLDSARSWHGGGAPRRGRGICLLAGLISLAWGAPMASAAQIEPVAFARAFCAARSNGVPIGQAVRLATDLSLDISRPNPPVINGVSLDVKQAAAAAMSLCRGAFRD